MRFLLALLFSITLALSASGCFIGPSWTGPLVIDQGDHSPSRRETTRWEPTPTEVGVRPQVGRATLQGPPAPVSQASGTTNDPWARSSSSGIATQTADPGVTGVNGRTGWIH